jgi:hypothetical protein
MSEPLRSNEELLALVGPWAKARHPEKYKATLAQVAKPRAFRNYLIRLIEIRCEEEPDFYLDPGLTVSVLDETNLMRRIRIKATGDEFVVAGAGYKGQYTMRWSMLAELPDDFALLASAIKTLDLEVVG